MSAYLFTEDRGCTDHVDNVQLFLKHLDENLGEEQNQIVSKSCEYFSTKNADVCYQEYLKLYI